MIKSLLLAFVAALALSGCNTMNGLGKDIQKVGEKIEDSAAKKTK